ncbi:uncharacterized protein LOC125495661 [Beta vulgaris subsp. vulgaris]|uniref:uncharacterized protein LOC125495661 n=1 Tax=Beta vulgaris subsp. vulgaris TaxID=3555 RepID=UPI00203732C4|nr:uncharacterized protein LOC125495661 [Beta vulgaris subsp. vulgaris]
MAKGSKAVKTMNAYEKGRMQRVDECRTRLLESGILDISRSLTNLNEEQHLEQQHEGSATTAFEPNKPSKQQRQVGENGKRKAPTMAELILKKKQPNQEAALETPTPLASCIENQLGFDADLEWLLKLDETRHVNVDKEDKIDGESQNLADDGKSAAKENDEAVDDDGNDEEVDSDKGDMDDSDNEDVDDSEAEQNTVNETEQQVLYDSSTALVMVEIKAYACVKFYCTTELRIAIGRGPTMMHAVHIHPFEKREAIILNEFGQPIGSITPEKDTISEFSRFLGTIARDYGNAPVTCKSWRKVPGKDKLWEYILSKYLVPEEGKEWVLKSIGAAWRIHKCRFKKRHYHKYTTNNLRWLKRPKTMHEEDFKQVLVLWNKKEEKARCSLNQSRRKAQKNNHTAGPKSFARIHEEMKNEDPNKQLPSLAQVFQRTRARDEKKKYADTFEDTSRKIDIDIDFATNNSVYVNYRKL